ncbi:hypothetical protein B0H13DRAFT_2529437 [Mycena leptocephala]|nr:hypothetical protein B0H13DRAFT_2529437 [Mycena leptocephala]
MTKQGSKKKGKLPEDGAEVIPASDARAAGWRIFDNAACRRMIPFLNPSVIIKSKPNTLLPILRGVQPCVAEFHTKKPQASDDLIAFIHMLSKCTLAAVEQFKTITEAEFGVLCRKFPNAVRQTIRANGVMLPTTTFLIPHVLPDDNPVDESVQWSDDDGDEYQMDVDEDDEDEEDEASPRLNVVVPSHPHPRPLPPAVPTAVPVVEIQRKPVASSSKAAPAPSPPRTLTEIEQDTAYTSRIDMLQAQSSFPPGPWVESTNWPLPAVQLVPSSFIQDGLAPSLYSSAPIKCITCIILKKKCVSRGHGRSCKECNTKKHNCSTVSDPARFLQMVEDLRPMINLGPEALSRALKHAIELRRDCDQLYMQLIRLLTRLDDATDEIVLRFSNMHDLLPSNFVPFFFEDSADVAQLEQMMYRMRQFHPHPSLEIGHLERNPTSAIETRVEADGASTEFYTPELPPRFNAPVPSDEFARVKTANPSAFQGYVAPSTTPSGPPPPPASLPAAPSQPHAPPEVYSVHPSPSVPSNASPRRPDQSLITSWAGPISPQAPFLRSGQPNPTMGLASGSGFYGARSPQAPSGSQPTGRSSTSSFDDFRLRTATPPSPASGSHTISGDGSSAGPSGGAGV